MLWRQAFDTPSYQRFFEPPVERIWPYSLPSTIDIVIDRATTKSYIAVLPEDEKAKVKADVKAIVEKGEDKVWVDEGKGIFEYPYQCFVVVAQRK